MIFKCAPVFLATALKISRAADKRTSRERVIRELSADATNERKDFFQRTKEGIRDFGKGCFYVKDGRNN